MPLQERCSKNHWELADDYCNRCGMPFSNEFLVYPFGQGKPAMCVSCALALAGVRSNAGNRRVVSRKELRRREKERKQRQKTQQSNGPRVSTKPITIDWSLPEEEEESELEPRRAHVALDKDAEAVASLDSEPENESLDWIDQYTPEGGTGRKITF